MSAEEKEETTSTDTVAWDDIPAETQHDLVALAETLGSDTPSRSPRSSPLVG